MSKKNKRKFNPDFFESAREIMGEKRFNRVMREGDQLVEKIKLQMAREKLGLNQADLEGLTQPEVSKIENREDIKISTLKKYAKALGMRVRVELIAEDDEEERITVFG